MLICGSGLLTMVVLTRIAEALHILPEMGWGQPDSAGHYLDLVSAILGCTLLSLVSLPLFMLNRDHGSVVRQFEIDSAGRDILLRHEERANATRPTRRKTTG